MKMAIRSAKKTLREFCVPAYLIESVNWAELKSEIQIENHVHDLIQTWFDILAIGEAIL